jgi:hypothetical protein
MTNGIYWTRQSRGGFNKSWAQDVERNQIQEENAKN